MRILIGIVSTVWKLYLGFIFVVTAILFYPFITALLFTEKGKRNSFYFFVAWSWFVRILCLYHVKRVRRAELPDEPFILIGNHASYLDIFLLYSMVPNRPFLFLGKSEILSYPLIKTYFKRLNIPVHRDNPSKSARSFVKAIKAVKQGWSLVIFPEGGIPDEENPRMIPFKDGAFQLAKSLKAPIVPFTFLNNYRLFSDPTNLMGTASPGVSKVYMHNYIPKEKVNELSKDDLRDYCFNIVEGPLRKHKVYRTDNK